MLPHVQVQRLWMRPEMTPREGLQLALAKLREGNESGRRSDGTTLLARKVGVTSQCISKWKRLGRVPIEQVPAVERATGIARHILRPDLAELFPPPAKSARAAASHPR